LFNRSQQQHDNRERSTSARQAAEALFEPKRPIPKTLAVNSPAPADPSAHKPRVLSISLPLVPLEKAEPAIAPASRMTTAIPNSQVARIRTWLKYGMTIAQAAATYGVAVDEVERILRVA
jgi:hypothetical protein